MFNKLKLMWVVSCTLLLLPISNLMGNENSDQTLRVAAQFFSAQGGDLASLDPARRGTWSFHSLLWAPLVWTDTAGNPDPQKSIAESWEATNNNKTFTFKIRKDAKYSDGSLITAKDIALSWGYYGMMVHKEARGYRDNYGTGRRLYPDIVGFMEFTKKVPYKEFEAGKLGDISGIEVIDQSTLVINFSKPAGNFIRRLTGFAPFNPTDLKVGIDRKLPQKDYWPAHAKHTGPYRIESSKPGQSYVMVPNEYYFGPKPKIERIEVLAVSEDINTIIAAFENKELDLVAIPLKGDFARQAVANDYLKNSLVEMPMWQVEQYWLTPNKPLDDRYVRRAFTMAINRQAIVNILNAGSPVKLYETVNMHRNPNIPNCVKETKEVTILKYDPEMAMTELKKSKYWPEVQNMEINIYPGSPDNVARGEVVKKMLEDNLGLKKVKVRIEKVKNRNKPPFPFHFWNNTQQPWYSDITDTLQNMVFLMKDKEWKDSDPRGFVTVAYEPNLRNLVERAMSEQDEGERCNLVGQSGQEWNDVAFSIDYAIPAAYFLKSPKVKGELDWYKNAAQGKPQNIENWIVSDN